MNKQRETTVGWLSNSSILALLLASTAGCLGEGDPAGTGGTTVDPGRASGNSGAGAPEAVYAQSTTKTFIDYLQPTPITCAPLSSATWGVAGVLPRDLCNGIESAKGAGVPPDYYYWDGQILKARDGKYHLFMSTWSGSAGFNPGWTGSDAYHAISEQGVLGPYKRQGYVYTNNGSHRGHNVSAAELPDGSYAVVVSETVPFTIYRSSSLDGPWTGCTATIQTNGVNAGSDTHYDSNVSLIPRHDGKFEIVQRHGLIAIADTLCGPYKMQKPTWTYAAANRPTIDSIYPRRTTIPGVSNPTFAWEEDPHIWRSGGLYHVLYSGSGDRVGWHLYSPDGVNNWVDGGLAFNPRLYQKIFCYGGSSTCTQWYKMERPGVVLDNGRVTHVTWAVADVDKDSQIPAGSNHGSKVIVVPFDGVTFEADYGTGGSGGAGGAGGSGGVGGTGGTGGSTNTNLAPSIASPAAASSNPVTGTTTALSVLGSDDGGEANLIYTWAAVSTPPAAVSFSPNGTHASKVTTATFTKAGSYTLQVTVKDQPGLFANSSVVVAVNQTLASIVVAPSSATVATTAAQQFTATARDQFAASLTSQPTFTWTASGGGTITAGGLYTAGTTAGGPYTITAQSGTVSGSATLTVGPSAVYQIDCGSGSAASPFKADQYASGGTLRTVTNAIAISGITNPAPAAVYRSERYGNSTYTFPSLAAGSQYTVRLHFAELYWSGSGRRLFNVFINGTSVLSRFDVYATAGGNYKALVREFTTTANSSGQIVLKFDTVTDNATIEGVEIIKK